MLRQTTTVRVPVRLLDGFGAPVTGRVAADLLSTQFHVTKADGTIVDIAAVLGTNFFEIDSVKFPGLYHIQLTSASVSVLGPVQWSVVPAAGLFVPVVGADTVESDLAIDTATIEAALIAIEGSGFTSVADSLVAIQAAIATVPGAVWDQLRAGHLTAGSYGELMRLIKQVLSGHVKIDVGLGTETVYQEDNTTPLQTSALKDPASIPAGLNATERLAAV